MPSKKKLESLDWLTESEAESVGDTNPSTIISDLQVWEHSGRLMLFSSAHHALLTKKRLWPALTLSFMAAPRDKEKLNCLSLLEDDVPQESGEYKRVLLVRLMRNFLAEFYQLRDAGGKYEHDATWVAFLPCIHVSWNM